MMIAGPTTAIRSRQVRPACTSRDDPLAIAACRPQPMLKRDSPRHPYARSPTRDHYIVCRHAHRRDSASPGSCQGRSRFQLITRRPGSKQAKTNIPSTDGYGDRPVRAPTSGRLVADGPAYLSGRAWVAGSKEGAAAVLLRSGTRQNGKLGCPAEPLCCTDRQADAVSVTSFVVRRGGYTPAGRVRACDLAREQRRPPQWREPCVSATHRRSRA